MKRIHNLLLNIAEHSHEYKLVLHINLFEVTQTVVSAPKPLIHSQKVFNQAHEADTQTIYSK